MELKHEYGQYFTDKLLCEYIVDKGISYLNKIEDVLK